MCSHCTNNYTNPINRHLISALRGENHIISYRLAAQRVIGLSAGEKRAFQGAFYYDFARVDTDSGAEQFLLV